MSRRDSRRRALEVLYGADVLRRDLAASLERAQADAHAARPDRFATVLVRGVANHLDEIDEIIGRHARGWSVGRMPVVDRNILRLAVFELLHEDETPDAVVIDEAVELAKTMSTDDSPRYVNGVLAAVLRARDRDAS